MSQLDSRLSIARGPANIDGKAPFTFFVAVLNGKREIILRQGFPVIVEFRAGEPRIDFEDSVTLEIIKEPEVLPPILLRGLRVGRTGLRQR